MKSPPQSPQARLRTLAIKLLAQREHSRAELQQKLVARIRTMVTAAETGPSAETPGLPTVEDIDHVLDQLEQKGLLSDTRAAQAYVRSRATRFGTARLSHDLRRRGIDEELIDLSLAQEEIADEYTRAASVWHSKFGSAPRDAREWARQARFLQGRGFAPDIIRKLLKHIEARNKSGNLPQDGETQE